MSLVHLALRNRALALVVCATGTASFSAGTIAPNVYGYTRDTGSFLAEKFAPGMEVIPSGFTDTTPRMVQAVTALVLYTTSAPADEVAASGRALTVGAPSAIALGNTRFDPPTDGRGYLEEQFVPGSGALTTTAPNGLVVAKGVYVLRWFAPADSGDLGLRTCADAMKLRFPPAWAQALSDGSTVRTNNTSLPNAGQITNRNGRAMCVITIPWRHEYHAAA